MQRSKKKIAARLGAIVLTLSMAASVDAQECPGTVVVDTVRAGKQSISMTNNTGPEMRSTGELMEFSVQNSAEAADNEENTDGVSPPR